MAKNKKPHFFKIKDRISILATRFGFDRAVTNVLVVVMFGVNYGAAGVGNINTMLSIQYEIWYSDEKLTAWGGINLLSLHI